MALYMLLCVCVFMARGWGYKSAFLSASIDDGRGGRGGRIVRENGFVGALEASGMLGEVNGSMIWLLKSFAWG